MEQVIESVNGRDIVNFIDMMPFPKRIQTAREAACEAGLNHIQYHVMDIDQIELKRNHYDVVIAEMSSHHFLNLEQLFSKIQDTLKSDGMFIINEFIGPSKIQWSDKQLGIINALLKIIPKDFRKYVRNPK